MFESLFDRNTVSNKATLFIRDQTYHYIKHLDKYFDIMIEDAEFYVSEDDFERMQKQRSLGLRVYEVFLDLCELILMNKHSEIDFDNVEDNINDFCNFVFQFGPLNSVRNYIPPLIHHISILTSGNDDGGSRYKDEYDTYIKQSESKSDVVNDDEKTEKYVLKNAFKNIIECSYLIVDIVNKLAIIVETNETDNISFYRGKMYLIHRLEFFLSALYTSILGMQQIVADIIEKKYQKEKVARKNTDET